MDILICTKIKKQINKALLNGLKSVTLATLSEFEKDELEQCGYIVKKKGNQYIISQ